MFSAPSSTCFAGIRWDAADAAGRERAYGTCGGAGVGEDAQRRERGRLAPGRRAASTFLT